MAMTSIGDLARGLMLSRSTTTLKLSVDAETRALATGLRADPLRERRGDAGPLAAIAATQSRLAGWQNAAGDVARRLEWMQTTLATIQAATADITGVLVSAGGSAQGTQVDTAGLAARDIFTTVVGLLNAGNGGRNLFAGAASTTAALADPDTLLAAAATAATGAATAEDAVAAVRAWFDDPAGFGTTGYLGSAPGGATPIAANEDIAIDVTAADPALTGLLAGLATAALLGSGLFAGDAAARAETARLAGVALLENAPSRAQLSATLALGQGRTERAMTRHAAEATALDLMRATLVAADPYDAAAALETAQTQLETLYTVTARLSRFSLADFLR
jgi:flagellar hook-associated protein 3 FlgL